MSLSGIEASTKFIALIGDPVEHSMTPIIQNEALAQLGLNVRNIAFRVPSEKLGEAVRGARALGILGLMVTLPHKQAVLAFADEVDELGRLTGSVNLLHFDGDRIKAYNSDGYGASQSLKDEGFNVSGKTVTVLGAGGAGRCLAFQMVLDGAQQIFLLNRSLQKAQEVAAEVRSKLSDARITALPLTDESLASALSESQLLINATSIGMHPHDDETPVPENLLRKELTVLDIVYNPLETRLLREAKQVGAQTIDGVGMLVYTNVRAVQVCVGVTPSFDLMKRRCVQELKKRQPMH